MSSSIVDPFLMVRGATCGREEKVVRKCAWFSDFTPFIIVPSAVSIHILHFVGVNTSFFFSVATLDISVARPIVLMTF